MIKIDAGKCIREAQKERGISNQKMAEDYGVVRQQVHRWRNNETMNLRSAHEFAKYFGMGIFEFLKLGKVTEDVDTVNK